MKPIGLSLIFFCCASIGLIQSQKVHNGAKQLKEIHKFMIFIKEQIFYYNSTLEKIYNSYESTNNKINELISNINTFGWFKAFDSTEGIYIPKESILKLKEYGQTLGKTNKEEQRIHNDRYIALIEKDLKELEQKVPEKSKLSIALGIFSGLMIVILFI